MITLQRLNVYKIVDSEAKAKILQREGFVVVEPAAKKDGAIEKMTKAELEAKAAELGVDVSKAKNNEERIALILAAAPQ